MSGALSAATTVVQVGLITPFKLAFELSPIILCGGIAQNSVGGMMPILQLTQPDLTSFNPTSIGPNGLLLPVTLDQYFAHWVPLPGGEIGKNKVSTFPFANQAVAGNAMIAQPLTLSMLMVCPTQASYSQSATVFSSVVYALNQHDALGGSYTIMTPKFPYTNMLRLRGVDASHGSTHQAQNAYQFDFYAPLLTLEQAQNAQNSLMSKLSAGTQVSTPQYSSPATTVGTPSSLATGTATGSSIAGTSIAPFPTPPIPPTGTPPT
jgi:hypothetical protein